MIEVLLVHPGGPFRARKDAGAGSIPKSEFAADETPLAAARREFAEETGATFDGEFIALRPVRQRGGKWVHARALRADFDPDRLHSNTFAMQWPPKSGRMAEFPAVNRAAWFTLEQAKLKLLPGQAPLVEQLRALLQAKGA